MDYKLANPLPEYAPTSPTPSDRAANTAFRLSVLALVAIGGSVWVSNLLLWSAAFYLGFALWLILWTVSIGLSIGALRNSDISMNAGLLRRRAWAALGVDLFNLVLVCAFLFAVMRALQPA